MLQDEDQYGAAAMTFSLGAVNAAIVILFVYLCYCALRDATMEDEMPRRREQLTALLAPAKLSKKLLQSIVMSVMIRYSKTADQEAELKTLLDNGDEVKSVDDDKSECDAEHMVVIDKDPTQDASIIPNNSIGIDMAVFGTENKFDDDTHNLAGIVTSHLDIDEYLVMFDRYDFDKSGTINSTEELQQLSTNVVYVLTRKQVIENQVDDDCAGLIEAAHLGPNGMSPREFLHWFRDNVQPRLIFL